VHEKRFDILVYITIYKSYENMMSKLCGKRKKIYNLYLFTSLINERDLF